MVSFNDFGGLCLIGLGEDFVVGIGVDLEVLKVKWWLMCCVCLDWSEWCNYLVGSLGVVLLCWF